MREPQGANDLEAPPARSNWTAVILLGGLLILLLLVIYFTTRGNSDQDKLTNSSVVRARTTGPNREKLCASSATYDLIKRELFRRAAQLRASDQAAFDRLSTVAVIRMENPVMESQDDSTGAVNCSGSAALDLPPGVQVVGGRHTLASDIDYTVTMAADGSGPVLLLKNADAIVTPLATLAQANPPAAELPQQSAQANEAAPQATVPVSPSAPAVVSVHRVPTAPPLASSARPTFDCATARTRGEIAVCGDAGLAALDRQMAAQYSRAFDLASPVEREILKNSAHRFYGYRDRCATNACIGDAYTGRMREISDIMAGRWQPPQ
ncbi:MAG TPA: hypothetical protein VGU01_00155 [Sphingomicrobium sp.]|nr:hypothetical protein [Sphingomicrobium sp.]